MKITNFMLVLGASVTIAACGGSSKITEIDPATNPKVYFAFDSSAISDEARNNLLGQSLYLKNNETQKILIEGHCDERGTAEYNLALGARRASAAKSVIVKDGVDAKRIDTISYGKERPAVAGSGESVWKWNRNAATVAK